ncbi:hypothetical protein CGSHiEE_08685 [Haemophilus influenzae PittEE]|nr:hypothetical protein CGSHiEE_08685 [Haemophilus influenzae PittEE]
MLVLGGGFGEVFCITEVDEYL